MGGFLNPPGHPEHNYSVQFDLKRRLENRGSMALSSAVDCEWLDDSTRAAAKRKLDEWKPKPLESEDVQDWILHVLGYFKNCFRGVGKEPECWHVQNLVIVNKGQSPDDHAGVHLIRKYYPDFKPEQRHLDNAYWGTKPEPVTA